jgi:dephospho-CoA kinase
VHLFGLTGGIASGKSAVAARLRARGVPVIDADELAREVVLPGTDGLAEVVRAFGAEYLSPDGTLDRKKLGAAVFLDDAKRRTLNAILHPRITARTVQVAAELGARGEPLACYEAALLVENGVSDAFRPLVVVSAPVDAQIGRAARRDGATDTEVRARIQAQMPLATKVKVADFVLENDGSLDDLRAKADDVLDAVCARLGVAPARYPRVPP